MQPVNLNLLIYCCWITTFYWIMLLWVSINICGYWFSVALLCVRPIINVPLSCVWVCVLFLPTSERACLREKPIGVGLGSSSGWKIANFVWLGPGRALTPGVKARLGLELVACSGLYHSSLCFTYPTQCCHWDLNSDRSVDKWCS